MSRLYFRLGERHLVVNHAVAVDGGELQHAVHAAAGVHAARLAPPPLRAHAARSARGALHAGPADARSPSSAPTLLRSPARHGPAAARPAHCSRQHILPARAPSQLLQRIGPSSHGSLSSPSRSPSPASLSGPQERQARTCMGQPRAARRGPHAPSRRPARPAARPARAPRRSRCGRGSCWARARRRRRASARAPWRAPPPRPAACPCTPGAWSSRRPRGAAWSRSLRAPRSVFQTLAGPPVCATRMAVTPPA